VGSLSPCLDAIPTRRLPPSWGLIPTCRSTHRRFYQVLNTGAPLHRQQPHCGAEKFGWADESERLFRKISKGSRNVVLALETAVEGERRSFRQAGALGAWQLPHLSLRIRPREKKLFEEGGFCEAILNGIRYPSLNAFDTVARPLPNRAISEPQSAHCKRPLYRFRRHRPACPLRPLRAIDEKRDIRELKTSANIVQLRIFPGQTVNWSTNVKR
jgi:hypothetical protein